MAETHAAVVSTPRWLGVFPTEVTSCPLRLLLGQHRGWLRGDFLDTKMPMRLVTSHDCLLETLRGTRAEEQLPPDNGLRWSRH